MRQSLRTTHGWLLAGLGLSTVFWPANAALVGFSDCVQGNIGVHLVPLSVDAFFDTQNDTHSLTTIVSANTTGGTVESGYGQNNLTSPKLTSRLNVLQYQPLPETEDFFCQTLVDQSCPLPPAKTFAFNYSKELNSSFAFTTITATFAVYDQPGKILCISTTITPDFGQKIAGLLAYIPLAILILSGGATIFAGIFSPWGTSDIFRWTSNYGRDQDVLRLVTPGFGDCLQYIQFVVLTGSLSLNYPGFYQPAVSQASWSTLMFNHSFVSRAGGMDSLKDGVYSVNGTYGLDRMRQYVGLGNVEDVWAGMIIWLLVILVAVLVLIQIGFIVPWIYRKVSAIPEEDLRSKNIPFSIGNAIRIVFNYFLLPTVALSMFQFVEAEHSPAYVTAMAALVFILLIGFSVWLLKVIVTTRPRSHLFDDLPTVLLYGPLYNTYSDGSAAFALIPVFLTFIRGIAIGAVQPSGVAQVVLLAICEVVLILTLITFKPYHSPTSMNVYHTFFSIIRLFTTLLCIVFVPTLKIDESSKGWVGYVILLMHAIALVFGFFLNSIQTFVEVGVRLAGAGGDGNNSTRGGLAKVFGKRQLSRRIPQRLSGRQSVLSGNMTVASDQGRKSSQLNGRTRSFSGSSAKLLGRGASDGRTSVGLDNMSAAGAAGPGHQRAGSSHSPFTPSTPGGASTFSQFPGGQGGILGIKNAETGTPYYRQPRGRRQTEQHFLPEAKSRGSWASGDWMSGHPRTIRRDSDRTMPMDPGEGPSISGRATPVPPFASSQQYPSETNINEQNRPDYAVREVDFYYGVRGRALNTQQTRRLGTGPADPTGPVASATGWLKGILGGKTKDKGKGFEVVRSSRMPPAMMAPKASQETSTDLGDVGVAQTRALDLKIPTSAQPHIAHDGEVSPLDGEDAHAGHPDHDPEISSDEEGTSKNRRVSNLAPTLPGIEVGGDIELPTRLGSRASSKLAPRDPQRGYVPGVPRKSSKRGTSHSPAGSSHDARLAPVGASPPATPPRQRDVSASSSTPRKHHLHPSVASTTHMPFGSEASSTSMLRDKTNSRHIGSMDSGTERDERLLPPHILGPQAGNEEVRPASVGYVQQHRASDNIHRMNSAERSHVHAPSSTAELVDDDELVEERQRPSVSVSAKREPIE